MTRQTADRSRAVATWLFAVAGLVFLMVVVGGATRLTDSGLSITEWRPVTGAIPPLSMEQWLQEFEKYRQIPEYEQVNRGMSLDEFKVIYWWEWAHRLLGRLIGLAFAVPFAVFLIRKEIPDRLIGRCWGLLGLGGLQGAIGWWMVTSGLSERIDVAPERLTVHLGLALAIFVLLIWTGLEALHGEARGRPDRSWARLATVVFGLVFLQCLLGGLVAGAKAGFVYTDWPLMNGALSPTVDWGRHGALAFLHDAALVQFNHRVGAYVLLVMSIWLAVRARSETPAPVRNAAYGVVALVWLQALLGVVTLVNAVPLPLGAAHQAGAVLVLGAATVLLWRTLRTDAEEFRSEARPGEA